MSQTQPDNNTMDLDKVTIDIKSLGNSNVCARSPACNSYYNPDDSFYQGLNLTNMTEQLDLWYQNTDTSHEFITSPRFQQIESILQKYLAETFGDNFPVADTYADSIRTIPDKFMESLKITSDSLEFGLCIEWRYHQLSSKLDNIATDYQPNLAHPDIKTCPVYPPGFPKPVFEPCRYPHLLKLYSHFYEHCYNQRNLHALAGAYYNNMNKKFVAPTLIISALSSIASFIASSEIIPTDWKVVLTLSVGVSTSLNALVQSFSSAYQFDAKATAHFGAADNYDRLITEIDFEKSYPNNPDFFQTLEKKILDVKSNYQYLVPSYIKSEYYTTQTKVASRNFVRDKIIGPIKNDITEQVILGNLDQAKITQNLSMIKTYITELQKLDEMVIHHDDRGACCSKKCHDDGCRCKKKQNCIFTSCCCKTTDTIYQENTY
jgi:hypothetical protein